MGDIEKLHLVVKKEETFPEMLLETKKVVIAFLNDYLKATPEQDVVASDKILKHPNPDIKEIADFAQAAFGEMLKDGKLPESATLEEVVETYKNLYQKMPKGIKAKEWDPADKSDAEIVAILIKRFYDPRHTEEKNSDKKLTKQKGSFELDESGETTEFKEEEETAKSSANLQFDQ